MYIAFLIAYVCFYIHADGMDSRFSLSVGSLFAVIGNKYIVDSSLPESTSFTLVDTLHGLTLFCILLIISATAYSLVLVKKNQIKKATKFDMITAQIVLLFYVVANAYFILKAIAGN
jgi:cytochrome c biogenesis factor